MSLTYVCTHTGARIQGKVEASSFGKESMEPTGCVGKERTEYSSRKQR